VEYMQHRAAMETKRGEENMYNDFDDLHDLGYHFEMDAWEVITSKQIQRSA